MRRLLTLGTTLVFVGASLVGAAFLTHRSGTTLTLIATIGAVMLTVGLIVAFGGMAVLLRHDEYLAVRADGVLFQDGRATVVYAWNEIERLSVDEATGAWNVHGTGGVLRAVTVAYAGASPRELARHLDQLRMKARLRSLTADEVARVAIGLPHKRP